MLYILLAIGFVAVFVFILWRVMAMQAGRRLPQERFVCPRCNERDCICHKQAGQSHP
jgi:hypothetical protein